MNTQYFTRGDQIAGIQVNGMDILAVKKACEFAKDWTVSGKGPLLIEFVTYRYGGHSMSDPGTTYRTRDEVQKVRSTSDPIAGLKKNILEWGVASEDELKAIDKKAKDEVNTAVEEAKQSPMPGLHEFWTDIYVSKRASAASSSWWAISPATQLAPCSPPPTTHTLTPHSTRAPSPTRCVAVPRTSSTSTTKSIGGRRVIYA